MQLEDGLTVVQEEIRKGFAGGEDTDEVWAVLVDATGTTCSPVAPTNESPTDIWLRLARTNPEAEVVAVVYPTRTEGPDSLSSFRPATRTILGSGARPAAQSWARRGNA